MDPNNPIQRNRLFKAMESSFRGIEWARNLNRGLVEEYHGSGYGTSPRRGETILNLMNQAVDAYTMSLVANRPRVLVTTEHQELLYFSRHFQAAVNNLIKEIGLELTLKQWVLDAFFCVGIIKVHMADAGVVSINNMLADPGMPFASNVSIDNFGFDLGATKWYEVKYAFDSYRIPFDDLQGPQFDQAVVKDLMPNSKLTVDTERLEQISKGTECDHDEFEPQIDLVDVWVARDAKIYTYALNNRSQMQVKESAPVSVMDWYGPEFGPYKLLGFNDVPEQILPVSPASHLSSLARLANNLFRKQSKRARAAQINPTYTPADTEGAKTAKKAGDGEWICVQDASAVGKPIITGGVDPNLQAFALDITEMFDRMAGNLTAMMGLGAQADTLGQEQLIHGAVSKKEANMQYRVVDNSVKLIRDLGYMLWNDKFKVIRSQISIEGAEGYSIDATWTPEDREADFFDYNFDIDLFSMPYQSPSQRANAIIGIIKNVYGPLAQQMQMQGGVVNVQKLNEILSELMGEPRLKEVIQFMGTMPDQGPGPQGQQKPVETTRNYTRKNIPTGGTAESRRHVRQQAWLGSSVNPDQASSLQRPAA
jgi:hypothetical protein